LFFSAKTHKVDCPLRVIVSEAGTWQKSVALFLQKRLKLLQIDDPFLVKSSDIVISFLKDNQRTSFMPCSFDIKDLYYSLPHNELLTCIRDCIDVFGAVAFQNAAGLSVDGFMELLVMYLRSTFATWDGSIYLQRQGVCIGSCIAPVLSDLFLASVDRTIFGRLGETKVAKVFRYVDDFLVLLDTDALSFHSSMTQVLGIFSDFLSPLVLTHEVPEAGCIRFLDLILTICPGHVCWGYEPRAGKPLLPFESAHSKIVKRAIVRTCYAHALRRSCYHKIQHSFDRQTERLADAGFPSHVLTAVAESLLKDIKSSPVTCEKEANNKKGRERSKFVVIPYIHGLAHNLKRIAGRCNVDVLFSAPDKL
ncbi:unnamed protein product, partial [Ixodes hexagonus]